MNYLALGDSYTIGTSVRPEDSFPLTLRDLLHNGGTGTGDVKIVAKRGWTTQNLIDHLPMDETQYDLVTLLIGVNDLYDGLPFDTYKSGVIELLDRALNYAGGDTGSVRVLSIPDYTFTPFGQDKEIDVSASIDQYNAEAKRQCDKRGVTFLDITDISRRGIKESDLVADDGLHLSARAYRMMAERLFASVRKI